VVHPDDEKSSCNDQPSVARFAKPTGPDTGVNVQEALQVVPFVRAVRSYGAHHARETAQFVCVVVVEGLHRFQAWRFKRRSRYQGTETRVR
jgi:hypothetical protein